MANNGTLITAPDSMPKDMSDVLHIGGTDLDLNCKSSYINMWSKYKPVIIALIGTTDQFDFTSNNWKTSATWWKGQTGTCGIVPYQLNNIADVTSHCDGTENGWVYNKPLGGANSPYRLTDFVGYNHAAVPPISNFRIDQYNNNQAALVCNVIRSSDTQLALADLHDFDNRYLAFYAVRNGQTDRKVMACQSTLGDYGNAIDIELGSWNPGTWNIYPFITNERGDDGTIAAVRHSCPMADVLSLTVLDHVITISIGNVQVTGVRTVEATVTIVNGGVTSLTLNQNAYKIRLAGKDWEDALVAGESSGSLSNITVAAGSTDTLSVSVQAELSALQSGAYLWIQIANNTTSALDYMPIRYTPPV